MDPQQIDPPTTPTRPPPTLLPRTVTALAVLVTGASAGFFYAWADTVTPGLARVGDAAYVETFRAINAAIFSPLFVVVFAGPLVLLALAAVVARRHRAAGVTAALAFVAYAGVVAVTVVGNVPLNDQLALVTATDGPALAVARATFEAPWNALNTVRSVLAAGAFALAVLALAVLPGRTVVRAG